MPEKIIHLDSRNSTYIVNPNNTTVGAGALIPYKRGDDDVGWFISYSHS